MSDVGGVAADRLKSFIERIERLEEERTALGADIREIYAEAKGTGFDTKIMRQVIKLRKMDNADRQEQEHLLELYKRALGIEEYPALHQTAVSSIRSGMLTDHFWPRINSPARPEKLLERLFAIPIGSCHPGPALLLS